jgi:hypothetical protein
VGFLVPMLADALVGVVAGAVALGAVTGVKRLVARRRSPSA